MPEKNLAKRHFEYSLDRELDGDDPTARFIRRLPSFLHTADRLSSELCSHYGNTRVVAGAQFSYYEPGLVSELYRGNTKIKEKNKRCAELQLQGAARKKGYSRMDGLVVVSNCSQDRIKDIVGQAILTLLPCVECSNDLFFGSLTRPSMPIVTNTIGSDFVQVHSVEDVRTFYTDPHKFDESPKIPVSKLGIGMQEDYFNSLIPSAGLIERDKFCLQALRAAAA